MRIHGLRSLRAIAQRLILFAVSLALFLGLTQPAALAAYRAETDTEGVPGISAPVPGEDISELKEQRREWQSRASSLHDLSADEPETLGEELKEKLNIDELEVGHYDPEREHEKALERDPLGSS